ncbi:hypothetical protein MMC13_000587 [Lambiella insularis]|nr:hypothetical protein [Lambiella insularis]
MSFSTKYATFLKRFAQNFCRKQPPTPTQHPTLSKFSAFLERNQPSITVAIIQLPPLAYNYYKLRSMDRASALREEAEAAAAQIDQERRDERRRFGRCEYCGGVEQEQAGRDVRYGDSAWLRT